MASNQSFFEGCGREGPILCIFLCEFHHTAGPKITCQAPEDFITKEVFDSVCVYLIPKPQLQRSILTVNALKFKITGFPVRIDNTKYARNAYYFNLCFVCDAWARTVQYEAVIKKLSEYLVTMELESGFLSNEKTAEERAKLSAMLQRIMQDLNTKKMCIIKDASPMLHLKVVTVATDPPVVQDHEVPIFTIDQQSFRAEQWDLTTQQVLPYIDGFNHVAKIAAEADVENNLVKACVQNLVYYGLVHMISIFQYSNMYSSTPLLRRLTESRDRQEECARYVAKSESQLPSVRDIFQLFCKMTYGTTVRDLCTRFNTQALRVDERKLVQYGLLYGFIRRIHKYPVLLGDQSRANPLHQTFTGSRSFDEICCSTGLSHSQLEEIVESNPAVHVIWK